MNIEIHGIRKLAKQLDPRLLELSLTRGLNRTTTTALKEARQAVRGVYNIKSRDLRRSISVRKSMRGDLSVLIFLHSKPLNMIYFGAKRIKTRRKGRKQYYGVSARIRKDQPRKKYKKGYFIADLRHGERVFMRVGWERFPLRSINVITATTMFRKYGIDKIEEVFERVFAERVMADYRYRLQKAAG